ncbi:MAG: polyprenyl synthetase family protein, partial [Chloroflexi bacterium]|nr:polyprenyl synthetase family protein [Chloroflexota bacterium]
PPTVAPMPMSPDISPYLQAVDAEMRSAVQSANPPLADFYKMMLYHLGWADERFQPARADTGKRLRPVFCLLVCEALAGRYESALPAAAAVEILHNFSLVHDDIQDGDRTRRHRPTLWALVGVPQAINAGDALFALAQVELLRISGRGLPADRVLRCLGIFQRACVQLVEGQYLDMRGEEMTTAGLDYYRQMIAGKTAALLGAATAIGAAVATADDEVIAHAHQFGLELGMAFQMTDDILGLWGDSAVTGKPAGADLRKKKKSLPIVIAQAQGGALAAAIQSLFNCAQISDGDVSEVMRLMDQAGTRAQARLEVEKHHRQAITNLLQIPASALASTRAVERMLSLAASLTQREF